MKRLLLAVLALAPAEWSKADNFDVEKQLPELACAPVSLDTTHPQADLHGAGSIWILINEGPAPVAIRTEADATLNAVVEPHENGDALSVFAGDRRHRYTIGLVTLNTNADIHVCATMSAIGLIEKAMDLSQRGDDATAVALIQGLADQGHAIGQFQIGSMYSAGIAVPRDASRATKWYRLAAEQGYPPAQYNLGAAYGNGSGVPKDHAEAAKWTRRAAEQGFPPAQVRLATSYLHGVGVTKDTTEGVKWLKLAAEQGFRDAQYELGIAYYNGIGVPQDHSEAIKWYRAAAEQDYAPAQYNLAAAYANGSGVPRDFAAAYMWSILAADRGIEDAKTSLSLLNSVTTAEERAEAERLAREWLPIVTGPSIVEPAP